jgi:hypothetical protein
MYSFLYINIYDLSLLLKVQVSTLNFPRFRTLATFDVLGLLTLKYEDIASLRNIEYHSPSDTASHSGTLESAARYLTYERRFVCNKVTNKAGRKKHHGTWLSEDVCHFCLSPE